ncbi:MAG TPA: response regulator [Sphingomicrobium sp.]|jgi:two-component system phosphate regulon response regulator PhoB
MSFIIVADDDPIFRELLSVTLQDAGHVVGSVADGVSALQAIAFKQPDLAILDANMPGCSGFDVVRQLRASGCAADMPLIMLTARAGDADKVIADRAGADDYICKPLDPDLLLACVDRQLHGRRRSY